MASDFALTTDAIHTIFNKSANDWPTDYQPIVQLFDIKSTSGNSKSFASARISVNDGNYWSKYALLAPECHKAISNTSDGIDNFSIIKLTNFSCQVDPRDSAKKLAFITYAETMTGSVGKLVGHPRQLRQDGSIEPTAPRGEPKQKRISLDDTIREVNPSSKDVTPEADDDK